MRNILSIRGGGIRGIIPCCCLIELEKQLGGLTRDHIDMCAGTSTGALLTAAVAAGIPATELLKIYTDRSHEIFTPTGAVAAAKRVAVGFMYDPKHLLDVLVSVCGATAPWKINDSPIRVMISATAMNGHNWFFVRDNSHNAKTTGGVKLVDAAVASACAPTYFDHWKIDNLPVNGTPTTLRFFDGGAGGTANPAYQACVEAFEYDDFDPKQTNLVALGTGYYPAPDTPPSGLIGTISWVTGTLVDTSEDWVDKAVERQWPKLMQSRNPLLPTNIDEADVSAIPTLVKIGEELAATLDWKELLSPRGQGTSAT
jgi:patatin-like phospholipase/acyl hydrolase